MVKDCDKPTKQFKNPHGRPTKFKYEYHEMLIEHCAKGGTILTFCAEINVSRETLYHWRETIPGFSDSFKRAKLKRDQWWYKLLQLAAMGKSVKGAKYAPNVGAIAFAMKNLVGWKNDPETIEEEVDEVVFE